MGALDEAVQAQAEAEAAAEATIRERDRRLRSPSALLHVKLELVLPERPTKRPTSRWHCGDVGPSSRMSPRIAIFRPAVASDASVWMAAVMDAG